MSSRRYSYSPVIAALACLSASAASASVAIHIDKTTQTMTVAVDGAVRHRWPVSTGRAGYGTPNGTFAPQRLERTWFSRIYYNSPMPHSIFFHGGYAIHGSYEISRLGGPASHGCIRLHPGNAATLFSLVRREGMGNTRIVIAGHTPAARRPAPREQAPLQPPQQYQPYYQPYQPFYQPRYQPYYPPQFYGGQPRY